MIDAKIIDNGKAMSITKKGVSITLDYDEARDVRTVLTKFTNDNFITNQFLPCRKCGKQPEYGGYYGKRLIKCHSCGVYMEAAFPHTLVEKWNRYNADGKP